MRKINQYNISPKMLFKDFGTKVYQLTKRLKFDHFLCPMTLEMDVSRSDTFLLRKLNFSYIEIILILIIF
jgi:hypothetical protein